MVLESRTRTGQLGEDFAVTRMEDHGHRILERNWRWHRCEIDVISTLAGQIIFHEVKCRTGCVVPSDSLKTTPQLPSLGQQQRIVRAAHAFIKQNGFRDIDCRFDLWWVMIEPGGLPRVNHLTSAFDGFSRPKPRSTLWCALR